MSTDRQRLKSAIQRIAEQSPAISAVIGDSKNKGGEASSTGVGISDSDRDRLCCDGTDNGNANAGTDQRDPDQDGEDGLDDADPADLSMGQGSLTGVTDCATGEDICFDGGGWIPPDGWDSPTEPPPDPTWTEGEYWQISFSNPSGSGMVDYFGGKPSVCGYLPCLDNCDKSIASGSCGDESGNYSASRFGPSECPGDPSGELAEVCSLTEAPPLVHAKWDEDSCTNLAIYGGKIVGSKFDPENDGSYSAPRDELEVCDSSGNRILLRGSPTGGWKSIKALSGDIDPDTDNGYLYRPNGQRVRQISPSEFRDDTV